MLPKNVSSSRKPKVVQNSPPTSFQKRRSGSTQTANLEYIDNNTVISFDGKISKNDQNNYKKAIDFLNKWNEAMNEYLKKMACIKTKGGEYSDLYENLNFGALPNYMALFLAIQEVDGRALEVKLSPKKNSHTQTKGYNKAILSDVQSQTAYLKSNGRITDDLNNIENIPKKIQQAQYGTYPKKTLKSVQKSPSTQDSHHCPPLRQSARFSESNIRQTSSNPVNIELPGFNSNAQSPNPVISHQNSPLRQNQSFGSFNSTPSGLGRRKRPLTGLLSPNGMIASEINANGTPIIVRDMFEKVQNPLGVFVSQGNILKNISRNGSSDSSVILSDEETAEVIPGGEEKDDVERTSSPYGDRGPTPRDGFDGKGVSSECEEEDKSMKHHPLSLNERDLNSKDRNFISSIGIFTEAGELKANAKSYLERKEDVRRGLFRAPRLSQLHMTEHYNVNTCDSESLLSDLVSTRSSEFDE